VHPTMFRRTALRQVSSPEQLDTVVRVALPRQWVALTALLVVVVTTIVWACVATIPTTVSGPGYLLPGGGRQEVAAPVSGTLSGLSVHLGLHLVPGDVVGTVMPAAVGGVQPAPVDVMAPAVPGVISEVDAVLGAYVTAGQPIALVDPTGYPLVVYTYLPTAEAAGLPAGLPARVTFSGGLGTTYGYAEGTVESVSSYPVSQQRLSLVLSASALVNAVEAQGPSNEIVVRLNPSATTPSGIKWGSGQGPPGALPAGLSATVTLVLGSHHPVSDVF
jgi:HlyD family secretion protein